MSEMATSPRFHLKRAEYPGRVSWPKRKWRTHWLSSGDRSRILVVNRGVTNSALSPLWNEPHNRVKAEAVLVDRGATVWAELDPVFVLGPEHVDEIAHLARETLIGSNRVEPNGVAAEFPALCRTAG